MILWPYFLTAFWVLGTLVFLAFFKGASMNRVEDEALDEWIGENQHTFANDNVSVTELRSANV
jgi:hypothetical protein